ncbi:MAG: hypothetical protein LH615_03295 [Ferruginibacter sp.]|nr:hypothetical protein [Ferruginibacter sp.]
MMKKKFINFLLCMLFLNISFAQTEGYHFSSKLGDVKKAGFYNIILSPQINAHLKTDYSDVRIINENEKWVPHLFHSPADEISSTAIKMDLAYNISESNKINTVVIMNAAQVLNNIVVTINNTDVTKYCTLSGSNDLQNWFVISDSILLTPEVSEINTESIISINFPATKYRNLKLVIINRNKDPYNITAIRYNALIDGISVKGFKDSLIKNPDGILLQKDSGKISFIKIKQQAAFHFNELNISVSGVKYFNRVVEVYVAKDTNASILNPGNFVQSFSISNNSSFRFKLPLLNASTFYLLIKNDDNPPLQVNEISTSISYRYITAYLEKNKSYSLLLNNPDANLPNYDIAKAFSANNESIVFLEAGKIEPYNSGKNKTPESNKKYKWVIWLIIIATLCILLFFTKTMIKEVNKKKITDDHI